MIANRITIILALFLFSSSCSTAVLSVDEEPILTGDHDQVFTYAGNPEQNEYPNSITVLYNEGYVSGYDEVRGNPAWVAYRVFDVDEYLENPRPSRFLVDERTQNRVVHDDYTNSGYDRGHMAPNFAIVSRFGADAQRETFYMTNIIPQRPALNRYWWRNLEMLIASDYSQAYDQVWVIVGPVYQETGKWLNNKVKVPTQNYKIIKAEIDGQLSMKAFLVHQNVDGSEPHEEYLTSVRTIEELTGLNFNPLFNKSFADSIEAVTEDQMW